MNLRGCELDEATKNCSQNVLKTPHVISFQFFFLQIELYAGGYSSYIKLVVVFVTDKT